MGADVHMVVEKRVKVRDNETWVGVNAFPYIRASVYDFESRKSDPDATVVHTGSTHWPATSRNYELFAQLAGVRGNGPAPKGVPDDASDLALMMIDDWDGDGHSHTWFMLEEALPLFVTTGQFGDPGKAVLDAMAGGLSRALEPYAQNFWHVDGDRENLSDFRLIIWFDN